MRDEGAFLSQVREGTTFEHNADGNMGKDAAAKV
jgi:hypothetical protein